jgi:hypothetical protein
MASYATVTSTDGCVMSVLLDGRHIDEQLRG